MSNPAPLAAISEQTRDSSSDSGSLRFAVPEDLYPFTHRFLNLAEGVRIHYIDEGPRAGAPTIVFLHGNPTWSFLYRNIIRRLRSTYRCIAPDYPNFGLSTAPEGRIYRPNELSEIVEQFFDRLQLGPVCLMVHDWGG